MVTCIIREINIESFESIGSDTYLEEKLNMWLSPAE